MRQTRWRVALSLGALALVMGATAIRLDTHSDALQTPCTGAVEHLAGVWDPARRDALNSVLVGSATTAAASIDQVATVLDHYAADWATSWTEACEATKVRGEQSAEALEDRMKCLDRARIKLWAVGDLVVTGDAEIAGEATSAAAELPALDTCSDAAALRTVVSPPVAALARTQIDKSTREIQIKRRSISSRLPTLRSPRDSGCKATAAQHGGTPMKRYPQAAHTEPTTRTEKCTVSKIRPGKRSRS